MQKLHKVAIVAAMLSALSVMACILNGFLDWPIDRVILLIIGTSGACAAVVIYCTSLSLEALGSAKAELIESVADETRALHRSMVVTMEQYGDSRAIDAFVINERRHSLNTRAESTAELNNAVNTANVTPLRKRP